MTHLATVTRPATGVLRFARFVALALVCPSAETVALDLIELNARRAAWDSHNISDYNYITHRLCRCSGIRPGLVSVRSDSIVSVVDANTFAPLSAEHYLTVDQLFDQLQQGLVRPGYIVTAEFDPVLSYPRFGSLNHPQTADEEVDYFARDLVAVPEPSGAVIALALGAISYLSVVRRISR